MACGKGFSVTVRRVGVFNCVSVGIFFFLLFSNSYLGYRLQKITLIVLWNSSQNIVIACSTLNIKNKVCGTYFIRNSFAILTVSVYKQC